MSGEITIWDDGDLTITKHILKEGKWGLKPYECTECHIAIEEYCFDMEKYNNSPIIIGNSESDFERVVEICLMTMHEEEVAKFEASSGTSLSFIIRLLKMKFHGFVYEWDANKKLRIATEHKNKGVILFNKGFIKDSAYRFTKALKILLSIPVDVQESEEDIDGLSAEEINNLKAMLHNNLAACYMKNKTWDLVIAFCKKVLDYDENNVKALYKIGIAYKHDRNFEAAEKIFVRLLDLEPDYTPAKKQLDIVKTELGQANHRVDDMMKKMFHGVVG